MTGHENLFSGEIWDELLTEPTGSVLVPKIQSLTVNSSSIIESVTYRPDKMTLSITFKSAPKERYVYYSVPQSLVDSFRDALINERSAGRFFHRNIKGKFVFLKELER
jgi:hypothetical protein